MQSEKEIQYGRFVAFNFERKIKTEENDKNKKRAYGNSKIKQ